jgi:biopolymer transport protein ExbD
MRFNKNNHTDDLELNFIPLIDVLLVIIIFLMVSTTFTKFSEIKVNLPTAEANSLNEKTLPINVTITAKGQYAINEVTLNSVTVEDIMSKLQELAKDNKDTPIIINADALTPHQSVINVMEGKRRAVLYKINLSTKIN